MRINISVFSLLIVGGLSLLLFLLWSGSLALSVPIAIADVSIIQICSISSARTINTVVLAVVSIFVLVRH